MYRLLSLNFSFCSFPFPTKCTTYRWGQKSAVVISRHNIDSNSFHPLFKVRNINNSTSNEQLTFVDTTTLYRWCLRVLLQWIVGTRLDWRGGDVYVDHWKRHAEEPRMESCKIRHNLSRPIMRATYTLLARGRKCRRMFYLCGLRWWIQRNRDISVMPILEESSRLRSLKLISIHEMVTGPAINPLQHTAASTVVHTADSGRLLHQMQQQYRTTVKQQMQ